MCHVVGAARYYGPVRNNGRPGVVSAGQTVCYQVAGEVSGTALPVQCSGLPRRLPCDGAVTPACRIVQRPTGPGIRSVNYALGLSVSFAASHATRLFSR